MEMDSKWALLPLWTLFLFKHTFHTLTSLFNLPAAIVQQRFYTYSRVRIVFFLSVFVISATSQMMYCIW